MPVRVAINGFGRVGAGYKTDVLVSGDGDTVAVLFLNGRADDRGDEAAGLALRELCAA